MKITLIGSGNIASHLGEVFKRAGHRIVQVSGSNPSTVRQLARRLGSEAVDSVTALSNKTDLVVIAVPDRAIGKVAAALHLNGTTVVHTSGTVPLDIFPVHLKNVGIFYPVQTLTRGTKVRFREIPICIEARSNKARTLLHNLGESISDSVVDIESEDRLRLHLAAVIVNNFSNHLFHIAEQLVESHGLDFKLLHPLIRETARKATLISPGAAQTGPARRGDTAVIKKHLSLLGKRTRNAEIYRMLTDSIEATNGPRL
ncbi:MAG: hypothetical protein RL021_160 [Bacteroidota bacterium]|jgi:predicted short-subunit dehydrogenase-like oxidoreductase (DUF2520 family)